MEIRKIAIADKLSELNSEANHFCLPDLSKKQTTLTGKSVALAC
jgi:hypothetical protein